MASMAVGSVEKARKELTTLNHNKKRAICKHKLSNPGISNKELVCWVQGKFKCVSWDWMTACLMVGAPVDEHFFKLELDGGAFGQLERWQRLNGRFAENRKWVYEPLKSNPIPEVVDPYADTVSYSSTEAIELTKFCV